MKVFLVGGAVRDNLLCLPVQDRDWLVIGATVEEMLAQGFKKVGQDFPVFLDPYYHEEYSLGRTEKKHGHGYKGFLTCSTPDVTLEQDLQRRDLTINAIAQSKDGTLFDPYGGEKDLKNRILRHVSSSFHEDPLRVLRVARFAARFAHLNFRIAKETKQLMSEMIQCGELKYLTAERIWKETEKALLTYNPQIYFKVLNECGALEVIFPELYHLFGIPAPMKCHPEVNTFIHSLMTLTIAAGLSQDLDIRFAALFHDVGKAVTPIQQLPDHHGHNLAGINIIKQLCKRLRVPNHLRDLAIIVTEFHDIVHTIEYQSAEYLIFLFDRINAWKKPQRVEQISIISEADARGRATFENTIYLPGYYLRHAFSLAKMVSTTDVIHSGFKGEKIQKELRKRRITSIKEGLLKLRISY